MKKKLVEILIAKDVVKDSNAYDHAESLADYLLENGVIVPPCKVGDVLYDIYETTSDGEYIYERKVREINIRLDKRNKPWLIIDGYYFAFEDFGKNVFLSREEAEAALKGEDDERKAD